MGQAIPRRKAASVLAGLCAGSCLWPAAVAAQVAPPVPPASVPPINAVAATGAPTREEVTRPAAAPAPRTPGRLTVVDEVQRAPCALADARFANVTVPLSAVYFDHLRAVPADALRPAFTEYVGRTVPIATVCEIRDRAATILRDRGYLAAVQVPPQRIEGGVVHFDVLMPKLASVHVRGNPGHAADLIAATLERLVGRDTFNVHEAERYLLLVRDLPGFDVRLALRPANDGVPGDVTAEVSVLRQPYAVDFNVQDYGSRQVGRWGGLLRGELYDVLGAGDRLSLGVFSTADTSEQQVIQGGYDMRIGAEGLAFSANATVAWTHPDLGSGTGGAPFNVRARTVLSTLALRYPLVRSQATDLSVAGGLDLINQRVRLNGLGLTNDQIRTVFVRLSTDATDEASVRGLRGFSAAEPQLRLSGTLELRKGVNILNATQACDITAAGGCSNTDTRPSRLDARPRAAILRGTASVEYRPVPKVTLFASATGQYSAHPTLQFEQFSGGTYTVGRGYDPGAIQGDSGLGVIAELRYGSAIPRSATAIAWQPYAFLDQAVAWRHGIDYVGFHRNTLASAGGGVRAAWGGGARVDLGFAVPLRRVGRLADFDGRRGDTRVLLSVTTRILPWRH